MIDTLTVHKQAGQWVVTFKPGKRIRELFGTNTIPTPFTDKTDARTVLSKIQSLNPKDIVQLGM